MEKIFKKKCLPQHMRILQGSGNSFLWSVGYIGVLTHLTGLYATNFGEGMAIAWGFSEPTYTYFETSSRTRGPPCIICKKANFRDDFLNFPVNVHAGSVRYACSFIHEAHFTCLANFLTEVNKPDMPPKVCEINFKCPECDEKCYRGCFANGMISKISKYTTDGNERSRTYTKMLIEWLDLFAKNPLLLESTKNHMKMGVQFLVDEIMWALRDTELTSHLKYFMSEHGSMLFYYPRNILIQSDGLSRYSELSNRRLNEATPPEISGIFKEYEKQLDSEAKNVLAIFFFYALKTSVLEDFGPYPLNGPILDYLPCLSRTTFDKFKEKGIIPNNIQYQEIPSGNIYTKLISELIASMTSASKVHAKPKGDICIISGNEISTDSASKACAKPRNKISTDSANEIGMDSASYVLTDSKSESKNKDN